MNRVSALHIGLSPGDQPRRIARIEAPHQSRFCRRCSSGRTLTGRRLAVHRRCIVLEGSIG